MNKAIQPKTHEVTFKCASCGATYKIESTLKQDTVNLDVCANCHPFYKGGIGDQKVKGRAEKLSSKFTAGKENITASKTKTTKTRVKKQKVAKSLDDLK
ncbi:MAG: 50S ribosomal protein L31 [Mycoplasmataceae bacterium]|jgi:large subunit ribosomal protein L31|nr:50S ribosomal protein L31 [Mycoplasmataceae bacterium]